MPNEYIHFDQRRYAGLPNIQCAQQNPMNVTV